MFSLGIFEVYICDVDIFEAATTPEILLFNLF